MAYKEIKLQTESLTIDCLNTSDTDFIITLLNSEGWLHFIGDRKVKDTSDALNYLNTGPLKSYRENGFGLYKVSLTKTNIPIGICSLLQREYLDRPDIGFAFLPDYQNQGFAFESAEAIIKYCKEELKILNLAALCMQSNIRSINLLKKLGFSYDREQPIANSTNSLNVFLN